MENKLKELTEKLYNEGIEKGKQQANEIIEEAKAEAERILTSAKETAEKLVKDAETEAQGKKQKIESELTLSSKQVLTKIKNDISSLISIQNVDEKVKASFKDKDFLQKLILKVVETWDKDSSTAVDLQLQLPEAYKKDLNTFIKSNCKKQLSKGLEVQFLDTIEEGLKIGPKDSSYTIEFSDESFVNFFNQYLKPMTREVLFGQES